MRKYLLAFALLGLFAGCPTPTPQPPPAPVPSDGALFDETNLARQQNGLPPLQADPRLMRAAADYAALMNARQTLSHDIDGKTLQIRVNAVNYPWSSIGENIAAGQRTPRDAVNAWLKSPGHRANLLNPRFTQVGVGQSGRYYCQIFARPR